MKLKTIRNRLKDGSLKFTIKVSDTSLESDSNLNVKNYASRTLTASFDKIVNEVANWIFDNQPEKVKQMIIAAAMQRTTLYFDNDPQMNSKNFTQQSDKEIIIDDSEDDDDDAW